MDTTNLNVFKHSEFLNGFGVAKQMDVPVKLVHRYFYPPKGTVQLDTDAGWNPKKDRFDMANCIWAPPSRSLYKARVCWHVGIQKSEEKLRDMLIKLRDKHEDEPTDVRFPRILYGKLQIEEPRRPLAICGIYEGELLSVYKGLEFFVELGLQYEYKKVIIHMDNKNLAVDLRKCLLGIPMTKFGITMDMFDMVRKLVIEQAIEVEVEHVPRRYHRVADAFVKDAQYCEAYKETDIGFRIYSDTDLQNLNRQGNVYQQLKHVGAIDDQKKVGVYYEYPHNVGEWTITYNTEGKVHKQVKNEPEVEEGN